MRLATLATHAALLVACSSEATSTETSARTDASAPAAAAAPSSQAPAAPSCEAVCARASSCGLEIAERLAETGGPDAREALARAKTDASSSTTRCAERCNAAKPTERDAIVARRCMEKSSCDDFVACLDPG